MCIETSAVSTSAEGNIASVKKLPLNGEALWESLQDEVCSPWTPTEEMKLNSATSSLIIFDWDDTLLPTAALVAAGRIAPAAGAAPPQNGAATAASLNEWELDSLLESCADAAISALQVASKYGRVVIVTNSGYGWVNETASRFMPSILGHLSTIPVISARSIFEPQEVSEPWRWKVLCFRRLVECFKFDLTGKEGPSSLVSIGDGWHERVAAVITAKELKLQCHVKTLKLLEQPSVEQLAQQLDLCAQVFEGLAAHQNWVEACYSCSDEWGIQLEARAADASALSNAFASAAGVEVNASNDGSATSPVTSLDQSESVEDNFEQTDVQEEVSVFREETCIEYVKGQAEKEPKKFVGKSSVFQLWISRSGAGYRRRLRRFRVLGFQQTKAKSDGGRLLRRSSRFIFAKIKNIKKVFDKSS